MLDFYVDKLRSTDSLDFLKDSDEDPTEWFLFVVKSVEAVVGGLSVIAIFCACCSCEYFDDDKRDMGVWLFLWLIIVGGAYCRLVVVYSFGQELGFLPKRDLNDTLPTQNDTLFMQNDTLSLF